MAVHVLESIVGILILIFMGFLGKRKKWMPDGSIHAINKYLLDFAIPCLVFSSMQRGKYPDGMVRSAAWAFFSYSLSVVLIGLLTFLLARPFRKDNGEAGTYRLQWTFKNVGFMGIPLAQVLFEQDGVLYALMVNLAYGILLYSFGAVLLTADSESRQDGIRSMLRRMINPPFLSSLIGIVIFITGIRFPDFLSSVLSMIAGTLTPLAMFVTGMNLAESNLRALITRKNMASCAVSLLLIPAAAFLICWILPQNRLVTAVVTFMMAMPGGALCIVLSDLYGRDSVLMSEGVTLSTILSLITLPMWSFFLTYISG